MKMFLQTWSKKLHPRKRMLATFEAMLCMMALMPMTARAQSVGTQKETIINVVGRVATIRQYSTLYVGEVLLDGQQSFYYLYSEDITQSTTVFGAVKDCLSDFENGQYRGLVPSLVGATGDVGIAVCSNEDYEPMMNSGWMSAENAGLACLPDVTVVSSSSENLYATNPDFVATCAAFVATEFGEEVTIFDEAGEDAEINGILGKLSTTNSDEVKYEVVNGQLVKVIKRTIYYDCESITVIYTRAELRSLILETPLTFEAVKAGTITVNLDEGATLEAIQYKLNNAEWMDVTWGEAINLDAHDVISFRGDNGTCYINDDDLGIWAGFHFECSNPCYVYGNMMSLIDKDDFITNTTLTEPFTFFHLFQTSDYEPSTTILNHPTKDIMLPAITLTPYCYDGLFADAPNITRAPELPATTLAEWCYSEMFSGTAITTAPALPATTLAEACYSDMFMNCTNLTTAPDLPAATLVLGCYSTMFGGCTSLNYVKCLATDISADYCTAGWMYDVAPTGTFIKAPDMTGWPTGEDGIPEGWTVKEDMYSLPLTIEIIETNTQLSLSNPGYGVPFEYSCDGVTWIECAANTTTETTISDAGNKVYFRGNNTKGVHIGTDKSCYVYGNVMSMVTTTDFASCTTITQESAFYNMFSNGKIMNHPSRELVLPAKTLTANCYSGMFRNCTNLSTAPELPATMLKDNCYSGMFWGCTSLTTPSVLPASKLAEGCYSSMFYGCTALTTAPELPSTALEINCYYWMFYGCTNLESAPKLPATTLKDYCYGGMFAECTSLTAAPELPAPSLVNSCYWAMFNGCSSLNYVKCLATELGSGNTDYWLTDVAAMGTFVKTAGMNNWSVAPYADDNINGIPSGWTVENIDVFTNDGNWDVAANWSGNTVPADGSDVAIVANAVIPSGVIVNADDLDVYGTLTIADGGQLYHNNAGVTATVQKSISAYTPNTKDGWHLIGYSFAENGLVDEMDNLLANDFDLYYYDEPTHYWMNQELAANNFTELEAARGYLYANSQAQTIGLKGTLKTANATVNLPLDYTEAAGNLKGFNLVGNPFAHNVTTYTRTNVATECYRMNGTGTDLMVDNISGSNPLKPGEGFFVKATATNASITFNPSAKGGVEVIETVEMPTLQLDLLQNGLTIDRLIVKREGEPLEKLTLRENGTRVFAMNDQQEMAVIVAEGNKQDVSFKTAENGSYTISATTNDNFSYLHLIDNITGADVDLLALRQAQGPAEYTFEAKTSDYASRFRLVFSTDDENGASTGSATFAFISDGNIIITGDVDGATLQVIDMTGRALVCRDAARHVSTSGMTPGVYVLRLVNGDSVKTQKIVVR